jgi:hypothetical protein
MVHFPGFARTRLYIQRAVTWFYQIGFPHSEIPGSKPVCGSPGLIAAYRVLHRLLAPRHPPYALSSLTIKLTQHVSILHRMKTSETSRKWVLQPFSVCFGVAICLSGVIFDVERPYKRREEESSPFHITLLSSKNLRFITSCEP